MKHRISLISIVAIMLFEAAPTNIRAQANPFASPAGIAISHFTQEEGAACDGPFTGGWCNLRRVLGRYAGHLDPIEVNSAFGDFLKLSPPNIGEPLGRDEIDGWAGVFRLSLPATE